jgi:lipopolysaccharide/colanic/teichoic acid biosynthesis glycosyltransferase
MDVVLALLGLVLAAPLMAVLALAIRVDSPGRVIFSQERLGLHGRVFRMHKFRKFPDWGDDRGSGVTVSSDARMTRFGRFLERSKFDEIPQLWNILKGEMSFVGPRPETLRFQDLFQGEFARVHDFVPGVFGPNQVAFRNESKMYPPDRDPEEFYREELFPQKARQDIAYFSQATAFSDVLWILRGLWHSVVGAVDWRGHARLRGRVLLLDLLSLELAWLAANLVHFERAAAWPSLGCAGHRPVAAAAGGPAGDGAWGQLRGGGSALRGGRSGPACAFQPDGVDARLSDPARVFRAQHRVGAAAGRVPDGGDDVDRRSGLAAATGAAASPATCKEGHTRIVVYGVGHRGVALATLLEHGFPQTRVLGFLDDRLSGQLVAGHPILGAERDLDTVHAVHNIDQLWLTFSPESHKYDRLREWCRHHGVKMVVLPEVRPFLELLERGTPTFGEAAPAPTAGSGSLGRPETRSN